MPSRFRPSTSLRGYGSAHQQLRRVWAPIVAAGGVRCARGRDCLVAEGDLGGLIDPSEPWDLGHDDFDRSRYRGPEHRRCNRGAAHKNRTLRTSRRW